MNISRRFLVLLTVVLASSCAPKEDEDQKFISVANEYMEALLAHSPELATALGDHRFDAKLSDYSAAGVQAGMKLTRSTLTALAAIHPARLNRTNAIDYGILQESLEADIFRTDTLREYTWNPLTYNVGGAIYGLTAREFAPAAERLKSLKGRLLQIPAVLAAARENLKNPPRMHTETAIAQNPGTIALVRDEVNRLLAEAPAMKAEISPSQDAAIHALEEYGKWLKEVLLPASNGDFRLGEAKFRRKLAFDLSSNLTMEEILRKGEADLASGQAQMFDIARSLYPKMFPAEKGVPGDTATVIKKVLAHLADTHPSNATIVDEAKRDLEEATSFVRTKNLVAVPDEPISVIVMPEFQRGVATAYCDAPGPLEEHGKTFFAISPTPKDWPAQRVESFYREYNSYMLKNLTSHEAMPGHYVQLMHANAFKAPTLIRAVFGSGTFVEGWATYAEQLMANAGYGGPEVRLQQLKMWLRPVINAIIDQKIHTQGMSETEAMTLMMQQGFQEEGEAAGKWRRACLTSTQLSTYYVGNLEINGLRNAYERKHGKQTDEKAMHDWFLSYGSPAPKWLLRELEQK